MSYHAFFDLFRTIVASRRDNYASRVLGFRFDCTVVPVWGNVFEVFSVAAERDFSIPKDKINEADWISWYQACIRGNCDFRLEDDSMFSSEVEFTRTYFDASQAPGYRLQMGRDWGFSFGVDEEKFKNATGLEEPGLAVDPENFWRIENRFGVSVTEKGILIGENELFLEVDFPATLLYLCELDLMIRKGGAKFTELAKPFELEIIKTGEYQLDAEIKIPTAPGFLCICDFRFGIFSLRNKYFNLSILVRPTLERPNKWPLDDEWPFG